MVDGPVIRRPTVGALLREAGIDPEAARAALNAHDDEGGESPWAIRALVGFGAWLCAIILLVLAILLDLANGSMGVFTGLVAIGVGVALRRTAGPGSVFRTQFALSVSVAGHALVIGFAAEQEGVVTGGFAAAALGGALLVAMPDPVHRFLSTLIGALGLAALAFEISGRSPWAVAAALTAVGGGLWAVFRFETRIQASRWADLHLPLGFGLAATLATLSLPWLADDFVTAGGAGVVLPLAVAIAAIAADHGLIRPRPESAGRLVAAFALLAAAVVIARSTPGVAAAALAVLVAVHRGHPVLFGGAVFFFAGFLGAWYYQMELTLFAKAGALAGAGALVLLARLLLRRRGAR